MNMLLKSIAVLAIVLSSLQVNAWNMAGHMVTGSFVYQELKDNKPMMAKLVAILEEHPEFDTRWAGPLSRAKSEDDRARILLTLAARWPDDARDDEDQHQPYWHFVSFPYPAKAGPVPSLKYDPVAHPENLVQAFRLAADRVAERVPVDAQERAIALCWLLHLGGDAHQPLHAVAVYGKRFPKGDKGGVKQYVRAEENKAPVNLHTLWDGLVIGSQRTMDVRHVSAALRGNFPKSDFVELDNLDPVVWTRDESYPLARSRAYLDGKLRTKLKDHQQSARVVPDGYLNDAKAIAQRRMALASHRLAAVISQLVVVPAP